MRVRGCAAAWSAVCCAVPRWLRAWRSTAQCSILHAPPHTAAAARRPPNRLRPLPAEGYAAWQPLTLEAPEWCDLVPGPRNREIVAWPNHPCQFLRNATAMGLAAALA